jgi:metal-responsive CopG/Arc/MetJ family transcriptional regulator
VKTAVSIPDATFERAERRARELGVSRSELYSKAVQRMLDAHEHEQITEQIDRALETAEPLEQEIAFLSRAAAQLAEPPRESG